jgi:D-methionine transport system permease protein
MTMARARTCPPLTRSPTLIFTTLPRSLLSIGRSNNARSRLTLLFGLPLAVLLISTGPGGIVKAPRLNRVVGSIIDAFRSTPFIILLVALIPFTRLVVGTSIGLWAAVVPLTVSATAFFARIAEVGLGEIDQGLVEAAQPMGARRWQIVWNVLLPEGMPSIIGGFTVTLVAMPRWGRLAEEASAIWLFDMATSGSIPR